MARKWAKCGVVSEIEEAILPIRDSYHSNEIFYCSTCRKKNAIQRGESYLIGCVIALIGGFVCVIINPQNEFARFIFQGGLFMCFVAITALPHELGHVLAAFATRAKVFSVNIGLGRVLYKRDFLGIEWKFCAIPICGLTSTGFNSKKFYRLKRFLVSLGGPLANFVMMAAAVILLFYISSPWLLAVVKSFIAANVFDLVYNLLPRKGNYGGTLVPSDGLTLLTVPFMSDLKINQNIEACYIWEGYGHFLRGRFEDARRIYETGLIHFPGSFVLQEERGRILLELGNYVDARNIFVQLQKNTDIDSTTAVSLLNEIATVDFEMGTKELLDEADDFSRTACEKMPWQTEFKGTRGLVLAKKGRIEEGLALLREAMDKTEKSSDKAWYASHIAEYENKKSNAV
jgi:hypothetical protein